MPIVIHKINLTAFRSYDALRLDTCGAAQVILTGLNGAGKTNVLEALSLLIPGKGLRGADFAEIKNRTADAQTQWAVAADVETAAGERLRIGTGTSHTAKTRSVRIDGKDVKNVSTLAKHLSAVWLTPQMDRIFQEGAAARRRFLDRLVFAFQPDHAAHLSRYEKNMRERLKVLQAPARPDAQWLDVLESNMAADAVAIAAARIDTIERLTAQVADVLSDHTGMSSGIFPAPALSVQGAVEAQVMQGAALAAEDHFREHLFTSRGLDAAAGRTLVGVHRSDFAVTYAEKNMAAAACSTGEQKGLLVSIVLAHAAAMQAQKGYVPLILLDEVAAHLDTRRRAALFERLAAIPAQVWLTGTDSADFARFAASGCFFEVTPGTATATESRAA